VLGHARIDGVLAASALAGWDEIAVLVASAGEFTVGWPVDPEGCTADSL
jgi:hypothetical protein